MRVTLGILAAMVAAATARGALVGAYYYPWYGPFAGGHSWTDTLRAHLLPPQSPQLGYYSSRDRSTIEAEIDQSHRGNISFWATSWWGPGSSEDKTIHDVILSDPRAAELRYAIQYESTGRLGTFAQPNYANLVPDFRYLAQNYFNNSDYLRIDGRPVVFLYLTRAYFNTPASRAAVADLRQTMQSEFHIDPYLIGDDVFAGDINAQRMRLWDAVTDFDVYGTALEAHGSTTAGINALSSIYRQAHTTAHSVGIGFVPTASPGFDDRAVRSGHVAVPRYLTDVPGAGEGSLFSRMLSQVVVPDTDPIASNLVMVNSFNEWHEDTQIEATNPAPPTTEDDSGMRAYTQGYAYSGYGDLYLDELRQATLPEPDGLVCAVCGIALLCRRRRSRPAAPRAVLPPIAFCS